MSIVKKTGMIGCCAVFLLMGLFASTAGGITVQEEEDYGREFMDYAKKQYRIVKDPYIHNYINKLGQKLLKQFPPQPFDFQFYVVDQEVYNAFAAPAGHIFIHTGLIAAMDSESELAGILGHEIAHVTCRHISENIERSGKIQMGTLAGMMAGILLAGATSGDASSAVMVSSMAAAQSVYLAYSREAEREADEKGIKALVDAGYSVKGLITMLKKIKEKDWYGSDIPSYLSTHPASDERIVYLSRHVVAEGESRTPITVPEDAFKRLHTRVLALYGDRNKASLHFEKIAEKQPESLLPEYGQGLLAFRDQHYEEAGRYFKAALEKNAFDPYVLADLGKTYFLTGDYPAALKVLGASVGMDSKNPESRLFLGRTRLELADYVEAQNIFDRLLTDDPEYFLALRYLGETFSKQGKSADAHYYLGLFYLNTDDVEKAIFNLERARMEVEDAGLEKKIEEALKQSEEKDEKDKDKKKKQEDDGEGRGFYSWAKVNGFFPFPPFWDESAVFSCSGRVGSK